MQLSDVGEIGLLRELERRRLVLGVGNDAAQLEGGLVVTQDALVEGVHFRLDWTSWRDLGYKAAAVNLSDLAASGAEPEALFVTLAVPGSMLLEDVVRLYEGLSEPGVPIRGGDVTASTSAILSVTAVGRAERVPGRAGAGPGDALVVTGPLGGAAAGYFALVGAIETPLVEAHRRPPLRLREGQLLAETAHALMDLSDGLAGDAEHMATRSGCKLVIELERVPVMDGVYDVAERVERDVWELVCGFGEDYELLAAVGDAPFPRVGWCEPGSGVELRLQGQPYEVSRWRHFLDT